MGATVPHPGSSCTVEHQGTRQRHACHCTAARETTRAGRTRACQRIQYNPNPNLKIILSRFMFNTNMAKLKKNSQMLENDIMNIVFQTFFMSSINKISAKFQY